MKRNDYLDLIQTRLKRYYDFIPAPTNDLNFALTAELHAVDEGYFLMPSIKMYSVQHHEYLYVIDCDKTGEFDQISPFLEFLQKSMQDLKTTTEHMNSLYTLLILCESSPSKSFIDQLVKYKFHKDYFFTLKGWSDLAIFLCDLQDDKIYYNKAGKKTSHYFAIEQPK